MKSYSVKEVASILNTSEETVRRWIRDGKLKANKNSNKEGHEITEAMLNAFGRSYPKYGMRISPSGGAAVMAVALVSGLIADHKRNKKNGEKNASFSGEEIVKLLEEEIQKEKAIVKKKRKELNTLEHEIYEKEDRIKNLSFLLKELNNEQSDAITRVPEL